MLLAVLAASLIPLLMLMTTVVPSADDFAFGAAARTAFAATGSVPAALRAAGRMTLDVYRSWQGSFSAVFLMALTPAVFGDGFYALTPVLMLLSLLGGTFCLVTALLRRVFRLPRYAALCTAALLSLFTLQLMPAPEQGLYWYNGALYYTFYYGLALSAFALALSLLQEGGVWRSGLLCLLCLPNHVVIQERMQLVVTDEPQRHVIDGFACKCEEPAGNVAFHSLTIREMVVF